VEFRTVGAEVAERQGQSKGHPEGYPDEEASCQSGNAWGKAEGSFALSEVLLPATSTWQRYRQGPSDHGGPTMSGLFPGRRNRMVESKRVESDAADEREKLG
jgi:hypothetical protein